jgi:hypothetical protein
MYLNITFHVIFQFSFFFKNIHLSLFSSVVIDAELDRKNHGSIPHNCDRKGLEPLVSEPTSNQIQLVVKANKKKYPSLF